MSLKSLLAIFIILAIAAVPAAADGWFSPSVEPSASFPSTPLLFLSFDTQAFGANDGLVANPDLIGSALTIGHDGPMASDSAEASTADQASTSIVKLAAPPAAWLMVVQGLVFVGFARRRRKWLLVLLAMVAIARVGVQALPRLFTLKSEPARARTSAASQTITRRGEQRLASEARTTGLDYVWMLRRADAEPVLSRDAFERFVASALPPLTKGSVTASFVPAILHCETPAAGYPLLRGFLWRSDAANSPAAEPQFPADVPAVLKPFVAARGGPIALSGLAQALWADLFNASCTVPRSDRGTILPREPRENWKLFHSNVIPIMLWSRPPPCQVV